MNTIEMALLKEVMENIARLTDALERMAESNAALLELQKKMVTAE